MSRRKLPISEQREGHDELPMGEAFRINPEGNLETGRLRNLAYLIAAFLKTERAVATEKFDQRRRRDRKPAFESFADWMSGWHNESKIIRSF